MIQSKSEKERVREPKIYDQIQTHTPIDREIQTHQNTKCMCKITTIHKKCTKAQNHNTHTYENAITRIKQQ